MSYHLEFNGNVISENYLGTNNFPNPMIAMNWLSTIFVNVNGFKDTVHVKCICNVTDVVQWELTVN